jgi:hypothetical protein
MNRYKWNAPAMKRKTSGALTQQYTAVVEKYVVVILTSGCGFTGDGRRGPRERRRFIKSLKTLKIEK